MYINRFHTYMVFLAFLLSRGAILPLKYHIPPEHAALQTFLTAVWLLCILEIAVIQWMCIEIERDICPNDLLRFFLSLWICCIPRLVRQDSVRLWISLLRRIQYLLTCSAFMSCTYSFPLAEVAGRPLWTSTVPVRMHSVISTVLAIQ